VDEITLGLTDPQYWEDLGEHEERISEAFSERDFRGMILAAPTEVRLGEHEYLPLVGVRASTIRDNIMVSLNRRAILVASRQESDEVLAATAFRINDDARRPPRPKDEAGIREGRTVKVFRLVLNDRIEGLPWRPGTLHSTLLLFDQRSNTVTVRLVGDEVRDPAVREFLAAQRRPAYPHPVFPSISQDEGMQHPYRARPDSPALPKEAGITLSCARVVVNRPGARCLLLGSFSLPVRERDVVNPFPESGAGGSGDATTIGMGWVDVGDPAAKAVVPVTLVLSGDTVAEPIVVPLHIPVYGAVLPGIAGATSRGYFAVDLFQVGPRYLEAQTYAVWAISRAVISQPVLVGVVTEDMLPAPGES